MILPPSISVPSGLATASCRSWKKRAPGFHRIKTGVSRRARGAGLSFEKVDRRSMAPSILTKWMSSPPGSTTAMSSSFACCSASAAERTCFARIKLWARRECRMICPKTTGRGLRRRWRQCRRCCRWSAEGADAQKDRQRRSDIIRMMNAPEMFASRIVSRRRTERRLVPSMAPAVSSFGCKGADVSK